MSCSSWKITPEPAMNTEDPLVPLLEARKFFAVDASGSTGRGHILESEAEVVMAFYTNREDAMVTWGSRCSAPTAVIPNQSLNQRIGTWIGSGVWAANMGGTQPASILQEPSALENIKKSDVWFLLTDGYIDTKDVQELASRAEDEMLGDIPIIFVIAAPQRTSPSHIDISVGITFFANTKDALIFYKSPTLGHLYPMAAKGIFTPLIEGITFLDDWDKFPYFKNEKAFKEACEILQIQVIPASSRPDTTVGISLGVRWQSATNARVVVDSLLDQDTLPLKDLQDLLEEEAITQLAIACKTQNKLGMLRALLIRNKMQQVTVRFEDVHGAGRIVEAMQSATSTYERGELQERLRLAHAANRETYMATKDAPSEDSKRATSINRLIGRGLQIISDFEKAGYTADILGRKSNRAMRAEVVSSDDAEIHLMTLDLSDGVKAFRAFCEICCGDDEIMSVVTKVLPDPEINTRNFALNFPLAAAQSWCNAEMISSQCICFQCSLLLDRSIYQEDLTGRLPTVAYEGTNQAYINHQLTFAVTGGLATGIPGISQIFMAVLDQTIRHRAWCSEADPETLGRRRALIWLLDNLLANTVVRDTFDEAGKWVPYPEALKWAVNEFSKRDLESWIMQYPLEGFNQLVRWYKRLDVVDPVWVERMQQMKLMHATVIAIVSGIRQDEPNALWKQPFLECLYREFNAPLVPRNLGSLSVTQPDVFWDKLRTALSTNRYEGARHEVEQLMSGWSSDAIDGIYKKLQVVMYWVLYTQNTHLLPLSFFRQIRQREPSGQAVTSYSAAPAISAGLGDIILRSLFVGEPARETALVWPRPHSMSSVPPFVTPFGPSILRCGYPGCSTSFYDATKPIDVDLIRKNRAEHLKAVCTLSTSFSNSQTGMPQYTLAPQPPTSAHVNLHVSVVRAWTSFPRDTKQALLGGSSIMDFVEEVVQLIATNHRGDIYQPNLHALVAEVLPSFVEALRVACVRKGMGEEGVLDYVHDWKENNLKAKCEYELSLREDSMDL